MALFVDTHSHTYLEDFLQDLVEVMSRAKDSGVTKIYMPAISSKESLLMQQMKDKYPDVVFLMTGLHPGSVAEDYREELNYVENQLKTEKFAAIGEIGLDFYWDTTYKAEQYKSFEEQLNLALNNQLPVVLHTRNAMQEAIDVIKPFAQTGLKGIFHCFGESYEMAKQIIDLGFFLGIGGVITYKKSGLAETMARINLEHIVLETDAPYLTPVPFRGKRNESSYIKFIAEKVAEVKGVSIDEVARVTTANAEKIFA